MEAALQLLFDAVILSLGMRLFLNAFFSPLLPAQAAQLSLQAQRFGRFYRCLAWGLVSLVAAVHFAKALWNFL